jgi:hypothetical protein
MEFIEKWLSTKIMRDSTAYHYVMWNILYRLSKETAHSELCRTVLYVAAMKPEEVMKEGIGFMKLHIYIWNRFQEL